MDTPREDMRCGICGQPLDTHDAHQQHDGGQPIRNGRRVTFVVVELRGALALYQAVDDPSETLKVVAAGLAEQLGISVSELAGCRYSCWVEPTPYGAIESDFKLA
ncbi:hypothetical protein ACIRQF_18680 [Streptomyces sp. NPDC101191]|uniref:hypothetical protein n=1 Tax=Streptomyces sp. NPDC101191 TaxID=3366126 RepID=UPI00381A93A4